jgi:hypothetical protein
MEESKKENHTRLRRCIPKKPTEMNTFKRFHSIEILDDNGAPPV